MSFRESKVEHLRRMYGMSDILLDNDSLRMYCLTDILLDSKLRKLPDSWPTTISGHSGELVVIDDPLAVLSESIAKPETAGVPELYDCLKDDWDYVWMYSNKTPDYASIESRIATLPNYQLKHYVNVVRGVPDGF